MEVKYVWTTSGYDPKEINSVTIYSDHIPRIGELVEIDWQLTKDEWATKSGRVKDVVHQVRREPSITVFLGL